MRVCDRGTEHVDHMAPVCVLFRGKNGRMFYDIDQAIGCGTIFQGTFINLMLEGMWTMKCDMSKEKLMDIITKASFAMDDVKLFL